MSNQIVIELWQDSRDAIADLWECEDDWEAPDLLDAANTAIGLLREMCKSEPLRLTLPRHLGTPAAEALPTFIANRYTWSDYYREFAPLPGDRTSDTGLHRATDNGGSCDYIEIPWTVWGDYAGAIWTRANCISLWEEFSRELIHITGDYGSEWLIVPADAILSQRLTETLTHLADYPVHDEGLMSELEQDLITECWDDYGQYDLMRALEEHIADSEELELDLLPEWMAACERVGFYPFAESSTTAILWDACVVADIAKHITQSHTLSR
jgi:hypothetical protein